MSHQQRFPVSAAKNQELQKRMLALGLREDDFEETYFKTVQSGGKSGLVGVSIFHPSSGTRIRCQRERSQGINRFLARRMLVERLEIQQNKNILPAVGALSDPPQKLPWPKPPAHWGLGVGSIVPDFRVDRP